MNKMITLLIFAMVFALSGCANLPEPTEPPATEPPPVIAAHEMAALPENLNPLAEETPELNLILSFLQKRLYEMSEDGNEILPIMAAALPADVTEEYAGSELFGVPADAVRGYAFRIDLNKAACWEDGTPITADDYYETLTLLLKNEAYFEAFSTIANAQGFLEETFLPSGEVVSLTDNGIATVEEAENLGISSFYLDVGSFWGLNADWLPLDDTTRLRDYAMPSGLDEFYVSAAWLYREYLAEGAPYDYLQSKFIGIPADQGNVLTLEDVGILKTGDYQLTLVLNTPATSEYIAHALGMLSLLNRDGLSYGPYRLLSQDASLIELERNEHWWGSESYFADIIRFRSAG